VVGAAVGVALKLGSEVSVAVDDVVAEALGSGPTVTDGVALGMAPPHPASATAIAVRTIARRSPPRPTAPATKVMTGRCQSQWLRAIEDHRYLGSMA
jgi:hypothetical protein